MKILNLDFVCYVRYRGVHLFVLVHGFQGNQYDLRLIQNTILWFYPNAVCYLSCKNEDKTEGDIADMGLTLANEVTNHIHEHCPGCQLGRLSFICFSLGGIIARAAMNHLDSGLTHKFYLFLSCGSPHLGFAYSGSRLVNAGMWAIQQMRGSQSMTQLNMKDADDPRDCFLAKLASNSMLSDFEYVVLMASHQDQYAPFRSAWVEVSPTVADDGPMGELQLDMARELLKGIPHQKFFRFDAHFELDESSLDHMIGRAAHIQFLENYHVFRTLCSVYPQFFI
jgi:hypothetical protein